MTAREEIVKTMLSVFAFVEEKFDDRDYPYNDTVSLWEDHLQAFDALEHSFGKKDRRKIILRHFDLLSSGRLAWHDVRVVYEGGKWVSADHDPRAKDPQFREYLRLKEIYGDDT